MVKPSYSDLITQILDAMHAAGCAPHNASDIVIDGNLHYYRIEGDKANTKKGWFVFYEDGIPAGAFASFKIHGTDDYVTWVCALDREISEAEREITKRNMEAAKAKRLQAQSAARKSAAVRAAELWAKSRDTVDANHPYLLKKQIPAVGIRQLQNQLVVPLHDSLGALHSLQFIGPDSAKTFLTGGAVQGHHCVLGQTEGAVLLLICEGYATGVSLHIASKLPVLVAFNAGNLKSVGAAARLKWPHVSLVFCADDDRWNADPRHFQIGERKARDAAEGVNGFVILPQFVSDAGQPTDFNDLHVREGLPALQAQLTNALQACQPAHLQRAAFERRIDDTDDFERLTTELPRLIIASGLPKATVSYLLKRIAAKAKVPVADLKEHVKQTTTPNGWKAALRYDNEGNLKPMLMNAVTILNHDPAWRGTLFYDEFSGDVLKRRLPPVSNPALGPWTDLDSEKARAWLEEHYDVSLQPNVLDSAVSVVGDAHALHVVREYLDSLIWDGKTRLKTWPLRYLGAADTPVHRFVGQAWLCGAVKRAYEAGSKFDNVLVLEGPQGLRKSTALAVLGGAWHCESVTDAGSKDSLMNMRGMWIIEFAELDALGRVESSRIKQHISAQWDVYRPSYGRRSIRIPRQNVFAASCNPEKYLKDETGARRFWPVRCGVIHIEALTADRDQLWAEAVHLYRQGEQTWATPEMKYLAEAQEERFIEDPWQEHLEDMLLMRNDVLIREVLQFLGVEVARQTQSDKVRVSKILGRMGFVCVTKRQGKSIIRAYQRVTHCEH